MDFLITLAKTIFMNLCMIYAYLGIRGSKKIIKKEVFFISILNISISVIYAIIYEYIYMYTYPVLINIVCNVFYVLLVAMLIKELDYSFPIAMLLTICISFFSFFIASMVLYFVTLTKLFSIIRWNISEYIIVGILQFYVFIYSLR